VLKEYEQFWTWMNHDHVPLTNNEAERLLRHRVIWRKTTYGNKSDQGLDFTEIILSLIQTLQKQNKTILDYLELVFRAMVQNQPLPQLF
jgi:hypothetical protein